MNNSQAKSYVRYTGLFNKVCQTPLFLVLAGLSSLYAVMAVVDLFRALGGEILFLIWPILAALFSVLGTIGLWMMYLGAKKNNIAAGNIGLAGALAKWQQVGRTIFAVIATIVIVVLVAVLFMLQSEFGDGVQDAGSVVGEISKFFSELGLSGGIFNTIKFALDSLAAILSAGPIVFAIVGVIILAVLYMEIGRYGAMVKFLNGATKMYKTGHMVAAPNMYFVVTTFVFAAWNLVCSLGILPVFSFSLSGIVYSAMMAISGIIFFQNKDELADIYTAWQSEIGMVNPGVAQQAPVATPAAAPVETPAATEENKTDAE